MAGVEKNQLIEQHLTLVQAIAHKVKKTLTTSSIEVDDLIGYGSKGLVEAAERFDARQGVAFSTFAYYRIRGAMYDGLRTMGWYSRADYARYRAEERANEYLQSQAEREAAARADGPSPPAPARQAEILAEVATVLSGVGTVHITSLDAAAAVPDERLPPPDAALELRQLTGRLRQALTRLPEKERRLMELYYLGDKNLEEAGRVLGLSKSWACRLHARAVDLLRAEMSEE
jgi:RNA polymerase sigma factor for flagellar operon FliA